MEAGGEQPPPPGLCKTLQQFKKYIFLFVRLFIELAFALQFGIGVGRPLA
jgi:hypothetical protein